jgi:hypothetical protein
MYLDNTNNIQSVEVKYEILFQELYLDEEFTGEIHPPPNNWDGWEDMKEVIYW